MAAMFIILLSCLACGIAAYPPSSVGRPSVPAVGRQAVSAPAVSGPVKGQVGQRPGVPVAFPSTAQRPTGTNGGRPSPYRPGVSPPVVGGASEPRQTVVRAPANNPAVSGLAKGQTGRRPGVAVNGAVVPWASANVGGKVRNPTSYRPGVSAPVVGGATPVSGPAVTVPVRQRSKPGAAQKPTISSSRPGSGTKGSGAPY